MRGLIVLADRLTGPLVAGQTRGALDVSPPVVFQASAVAIVAIVEDIDPTSVGHKPHPATMLAQRALEFIVGSIAGRMLRLDRLADRRLNHVEEPFSGAADVKPAVFSRLVPDHAGDSSWDKPTQPFAASRNAIGGLGLFFRSVSEMLAVEELFRPR